MCETELVTDFMQGGNLQQEGFVTRVVIAHVTNSLDEGNRDATENPSRLNGWGFHYPPSVGHDTPPRAAPARLRHG